MSETLYAVDVFSLVFQVFHAIPAMTSPAGQPTNAVFGFTRDVLNILKAKHPTYLVCAMDSPGRGVRDDIYPEYKANRSEMPDELRPQIPMVKRVIEAFGIPVLQQEGWEADDILASLAHAAEQRGVNALIVTNDKDARQLISPLVRLYNVRKDTYFDADNLMTDWGIRPNQVVDYQSLVGDAVDNVPGVPQIGPKTAVGLLKQFDTLDEILRRASEVVANKVRENLQQHSDKALMSRQLVELNRNLTLDFDWNHARVGQYRVPELVEFFRECGFRKFIDEVRLLAPDRIELPALFEAGQPRVSVLSSVTELSNWLTSKAGCTEFAARLETSGLDPLNSDILGLSLAADDTSAAYVSFSKLAGEPVLDRDEVFACLREKLGAAGIRWIGHDLKPLVNRLHRAGFESPELGLDTMVGAYLLDAGSRSHSLSGLVDRYCGSPLEPLSLTLATDDGTIAPQTPAVLSQAGAEEVCLTVRVAAKLRAELASQELATLYEQLERPLIGVLAELERTGVKVDAEELGRQNVEVTARIDELMQRIHSEAGEEFNVDSPKQLRVILFEKLGLPVLKKTKTGPSTDQEVLEKLALVHPLPALIIEHRHLVKLKGTYLDALPTMIHPQTGRIHASFNQVVAATGRLSSSNPNLQNIPIRTAEGERIRRAFVPGHAGWKLICADYSQIELRMLAHFCQDAALQHAFANDIDVHAAVAAEVFGVPTSEVTSEQRRVAKAVNFGVIYGQSAYGLSEALGITREQATTFIEGYFVKYNGVAEFMSRTLDEVAETGFAKTILGRRRAITGIRAERTGQLSMPERTAVNTVIQGSAADLIKQAMINISVRLKREPRPGRMLMRMHDELVFETPESDAESLIELVRHEMEHALPLSVPVKVDIAMGDNWLDAKG